MKKLVKVRVNLYAYEQDVELLKTFAKQLSTQTKLTAKLNAKIAKTRNNALSIIKQNREPNK